MQATCCCVKLFDVYDPINIVIEMTTMQRSLCGWLQREDCGCLVDASKLMAHSLRKLPFQRTGCDNLSHRDSSSRTPSPANTAAAPRPFLVKLAFSITHCLVIIILVILALLFTYEGSLGIPKTIHLSKNSDSSPVDDLAAKVLEPIPGPAQPGNKSSSAESAAVLPAASFISKGSQAVNTTIPTRGPSQQKQKRPSAVPRNVKPVATEAPISSWLRSALERNHQQKEWSEWNACMASGNVTRPFQVKDFLAAHPPE